MQLAKTDFQLLEWALLLMSLPTSIPIKLPTDKAFSSPIPAVRDIVDAVQHKVSRSRLYVRRPYIYTCAGISTCMHAWLIISYVN
jgi:hypothetical protein